MDNSQNNSDKKKKKTKRGFASMDPEKQKRIASMGGKEAHRSGKAHQWSPEEARKAGRKGGQASRRKKK